ncbi:MAG: A/G-specific adenine glycosylase [Bacteroidetes bacterium]|nr:A/G-specific adenine glycosylase [Bacteroidota bacterium]
MKRAVLISALHKKILRWYRQNGRELPWRKTSDPYRILLSEIMAQQTQVSRVEIFYTKWLAKFPTLQSAARAKTREILLQWSGLGYNSRALRLHALAKFVVKNYRSRLPHSVEELQKLPGIGAYTSHAVACFAFRQQLPVVDVNIKRILLRIFGYTTRLTDKEIWKLAEEILPSGKAYHWNQALMDFGAVICTARNPKCAICPVQKECASAFSPMFNVPEKRKKKEPSRKGIPRRLYRGKILKMLHYTVLTEKEIAEQLWHSFSSRDVLWLHNLLHQMIADGLLKRLRGKLGIAE